MYKDKLDLKTCMYKYSIGKLMKEEENKAIAVVEKMKKLLVSSVQ